MNPFAQRFDVFLSLLFLSVLYFLFFTVTAQGTGILLVFWSIFSLICIVRIDQFIKFSDNDDKLVQKRILPHALVSLMRRRQSIDEYRKVLKTFDHHLFLSGFFILAYFLLAILASLKGIHSSEYQDIVMQMNALLPDIHIEYDPYYQKILTVFAQYLLITIVYFLCFVRMTHKNSDRNFSIILFSFFIISLLVNLKNGMLFLSFDNVSFMGSGWGSFNILKSIGVLVPDVFSSVQVRLLETGISGLIFFYAACLNAFFIFSKFRLRDTKKIIGLFVLCVLFMCDLFLVKTDALMALWLSGWAIVGFLSGEILRGKQAYRISQI